jgi:hypothetical protein
MILRQFEEKNNIIQRESVQVVYGRCRRPYQRKKMNISENESKNDGYYLCRSEEHYANDCEFKEKILEFGKKLRTKYMEQKSKKSYKQRQSNKSKPKDEGESDGKEESCSLMKEQITKTKPSKTWAVDTGATSSMTDNQDLFSDIRRIKRVPIQVGGGKLYSNYLGIVRIHRLDESTGLLLNVLWVPNLGVDLVLARSVCKYSRFTESLDDNDTYIMKGKQVKIHAMLDGGVDPESLLDG